MDDDILKEIVKDSQKPTHVFLLEHSRAYREGFEATEHKNPYKFPKEFDYERIRLSVKNPFTEEDGRTLKRMNSMFEKCDWALWTNGYWYGHES